MYTQDRPVYNISHLVLGNWNFLFVYCSVTVRPLTHTAAMMFWVLTVLSNPCRLIGAADSQHLSSKQPRRDFDQLKHPLQQLTSAKLIMKKRSERSKHCALGLVRRSQKFRPPQTLFLGARDGQNLISWRWSLHTNTVWWGSMHGISSYRGNRSTDKHRPPAANKLRDKHFSTLYTDHGNSPKQGAKSRGGCKIATGYSNFPHLYK